MHILESRHGSGTFVASLSVEELLRPLQFVLSLAEGGLEHLFEVRLLLEPGAAELAAERATAEDSRRAARRASSARRPRRPRTRTLMLRLDTELHERIVRAAANPLLEHLLGGHQRARGREPLLHRAAAGHPRRDARRALTRSSRPSRPGEPEAARAAMEAHIRRIRDAALAASAQPAASRA